MKTTMMMVIASLVLAGCESAEQIQDAKDRIQNKLPKGCVMTDLGRYRNLERLVVIQCPARTTTTNAVWTVSNGKITATYAFAAVTVEDEQ